MIERIGLAPAALNLMHGAWLQCVGEDGRALPGIRGRAGAAGLLEDGLEFGVDSIEMQPGASFEPHVHEGAHILFVLSGRGTVWLDGRDLRLAPGDSLFVPADLPHAVSAMPGGSEPLLFVAAGYPHKNLTARDRMRLLRPRPGA